MCCWPINTRFMSGSASNTNIGPSRPNPPDLFLALSVNLPCLVPWGPSAVSAPTSLRTPQTQSLVLSGLGHPPHTHHIHTHARTHQSERLTAAYGCDGREQQIARVGLLRAISSRSACQFKGIRPFICWPHYSAWAAWSQVVPIRA